MNAIILVRFLSLLFLLGKARCSSSYVDHARIVAPSDLQSEYDFIIAGAGTAGLTVGDRLSERGVYSVLVVEYGYYDLSNSITAVAGPPARRSAGPEFYTAATRFYNITSEPIPELNNRTMNVAAGCVIGGDSAVNGMFFGRGSAEDYDAWVWSTGRARQAEYEKEWGWKNLLPWFKKSVVFHPPTPEVAAQYEMTYDVEAAYGGTTPIHASYPPFQWPAQKIIWDAWKTMPGITFPVEGASGNATGVFYTPNSIDPANRTRSYSRTGHYDNPGGAATRANFHILPAHRVLQVLFDRPSPKRAWEAQGVVVVPRDGPLPSTPRSIRAKMEVILSAGAVHTPQILQRSGIGPRDTLENAGVHVKIELPGVGYNLQDHAWFMLTFNYRNPVVPNATTLAMDPAFQAKALVLWDANQTGPYTSNVNSGAWVPLSVMSERAATIRASIRSQDPAAHLPVGVHPTVVAGYVEQTKARLQQLESLGSAVFELLFTGGAYVTPIFLKPFSRGTILIRPDDDGVDISGRGDKEPIVNYRTLSNPVDLAIMTELIRFERKFYGSEGCPEWIQPALNASDAELEAFIRRNTTSSNGHLSGTAALAPLELGGVVGSDLAVYGTLKLSIADNSIITLIPGAHTSSTAYAIGEKAS
ncbi:alcohol oxidase [Thozetella sp. PMI_491]|nr:alcohol oxidase [Thozetella sp. PMI_491]